MNTFKTGLVVFGLMIGTAAMAQGRMDGKSPEERAQFRTDKLAKELSLTSEQQLKVTELNKEAVVKIEAIRKDNALSESEKRAAFQKNRKENKAQMEKILTTEQLAKLEARKEMRGQERKTTGRSSLRVANGKHKTVEKRAVQSPEEKAQQRTDELTKALSLTDKQKTAVYDLNLQSFEKKEVIRKDVNLSPEQKKTAMEKNRAGDKKAYNKILTTKQLRKLGEMRDESKIHHQKEGGAHKGSKPPKGKGHKGCQK